MSGSLMENLFVTFFLLILLKEAMAMFILLFLKMKSGLMMMSVPEKENLFCFMNYMNGILCLMDGAIMWNINDLFNITIRKRPLLSCLEPLRVKNLFSSQHIMLLAR